jgi:hypothetical protein
MRIYKKEVGLFRLLTLAAMLTLSLAILIPKFRKAESPPQQGHFVLLLEEVDAAFEPHLHVGDRVIDRQNRRILGDILNIRTETSRREIFSEKAGAFVRASVPGKYDLRLTLSATQKNGTVLTASGETVRLGQVYYFRTYDFTGEGRVVELL